MSKPVTLMVVGCGARGYGYAQYAANYPDKASVVAVADPSDYYRNRLGDEFNIPEERRFRSWEEAAKQPKLADAVLICTQDQMHEAPAVAFADLKYDILLEKPMATTAAACKNIVAAVQRNHVIFAVCHVLRYTNYTRKIRQLLEAGAVGDIVSIQHLEPAGYWHQAHSFVRGNWRNSKESCFMLLAKSCHDVDWLRYMMNCKCQQVHSFGTLKHFRSENKPAGAAERCTDCPAEIEKNCPYSALKIYFRDRFDKGIKVWPVNVLVAGEVTQNSLMEALKTGPYGRCVYACDNDVVDNQVVNMLFEGNRTVSFTMTAFAPHSARKTRIFGTRGYLETDSVKITVVDFLTDKATVYDADQDNDGGILSGHGGGDMGLMQDFIQAIATQDPSLITSGPEVSLESHLIDFAAEESRLTGKVIELKDF